MDTSTYTHLCRAGHSLWIVIEAYKNLFDRDREQTAAVVDDLIGTGMYLPIISGESLLSWAFENELLP